MTLKELQKLFPDATNESWHRHSDGGGWIQNTAKVSKTARVSRNAQVYDYARVSDYVQVSDHARVRGYAHIYGQAHIFDYAQVCEHTKIYEHAHIYGRAHIYGNAHIYGRAYIYGNTQISNGKWTRSPINIYHPIWNVREYGLNTYQIGCHTGSLKWFINHCNSSEYKGSCSKEEREFFIELLTLLDKEQKRLGGVQ